MTENCGLINNMETRLIKTLDNILAWLEHKLQVRKRDYWERQLIRKLRFSLNGQYDSVIKALGEPPRLENIPASYWESAGEAFTKNVRPILEQIFLQQAADMVEASTIAVDWSLVNAGAVTWAKNYSFDLVKGINETSRQRLQDIISRAFEQDLTRGELEDLIREIYGPVRAEMIASTEVTRASVQGEVAIQKELADQGIEMVEVWQTNEDELVCDVCGPNDGKKQGDGWDEPPPAHPRCRCWINLEMPE